MNDDVNVPYGSLTRIAPLEQWPVDRRALPRDRWERGDYVVVEVHDPRRLRSVCRPGDHGGMGRAPTRRGDRPHCEHRGGRPARGAAERNPRTEPHAPRRSSCPPRGSDRALLCVTAAPA